MRGIRGNEEVGIDVVWVWGWYSGFMLLCLGLVFQVDVGLY